MAKVFVPTRNTREDREFLRVFNSQLNPHYFTDGYRYTVCMVKDRFAGKWHVSIARCSDSEPEFNRQVGRRIAADRMDNGNSIPVITDDPEYFATNLMRGMD